MSDYNNFLITNFATSVNGASTSGDYLSILSTNYNNSPYNVSINLTVTRPD